jgi:protein involved in polysaccharide export with SLBB domain
MKTIVRSAGLLLAFLWLPTAGMSAQGSSAQSIRAFPRPGDKLVLRIFSAATRVEEVRPPDTLMVNDRGMVTLPRVGPTEIGNIPIADVPDTVRARMGQFLRNPDADVLVLRRIAVNGEVRSANIYYLDPSVRLPDAIARAGGVNDFGNRAKVSIVRGGQEIKVPDWDQANSPNTELLSGDLITVGRKSWFVLNAIPAVSTVAVVASILISIIRK